MEFTFVALSRVWAEAGSSNDTEADCGSSLPKLVGGTSGGIWKKLKKWEKENKKFELCQNDVKLF